jgi:hypothetical protein
MRWMGQVAHIRESYIQSFHGHLKETDHFEHLGVEGMIILK